MKGDMGAVVFLLMGVIFVGVYTGTLSSEGPSSTAPRPSIVKAEKPRLNKTPETKTVEEKRPAPKPKNSSVLVHNQSYNWQRESRYITLQTNTNGILTTAIIRCHNTKGRTWQKTVKFGLTSPSATIIAPPNYTDCYLVSANPPMVRLAYGS